MARSRPRMHEEGDPFVDQFLAHVRARCVEAGVDRWDDDVALAIGVYADIVDNIGAESGSGGRAIVAMVGALRMARHAWYPDG